MGKGCSYCIPFIVSRAEVCGGWGLVAGWSRGVVLGWFFLGGFFGVNVFMGGGGEL